MFSEGTLCCLTPRSRVPPQVGHRLERPEQTSESTHSYSIYLHLFSAFVNETSLRDNIDSKVVSLEDCQRNSF